MVVFAEVIRGPRGRSQIRPDDETRHLIVGAAVQEFQANGCAATNKAQRVGVSTKTILSGADRGR
jgi:hypothetical protein